MTTPEKEDGHDIDVVWSEKFHAPDADVTMCSSDGVFFGLHRRNLHEHSEGFPGKDVAVAPGEIVHLTENKSTLELLFQYMYRGPQPELDKISFSNISALADAAEKYQVFSALEVCKFRMRLAIPCYPLDVLLYSLKHGYRSISNEAAPHTIHCGFHTVRNTLGDAYVACWASYREQWNQVLNDARCAPGPVAHKHGRKKCDSWAPFDRQLRAKLHSLEDLKNCDMIFNQAIYKLDDCHHCGICAGMWHSKLQRLSVLEMKPFEKFL